MFLRSTSVNSTLNTWYNFMLTPSGPGHFFIGRFLITSCNPLGAMCLFKLLLFILIQLWNPIYS